MIRNLIESNPATTALVGVLLTIAASLIPTMRASKRKINTGGGKYTEKDDNSINITHHQK